MCWRATSPGQPQSSAHARFIHLHDPSNGNVLDDTRGGNFLRAGEASLLSDLQERMKWALRVRTRAPFCLCQGVGGRQRVFVPFGRYRPPHVCRGRSRILRCPLSPSPCRTHRETRSPKLSPQEDRDRRHSLDLGRIVHGSGANEPSGRGQRVSFNGCIRENPCAAFNGNVRANTLSLGR